MKDLFKALFWIITLQWLFGGNRSAQGGNCCGGCGCINTFIVLAICFILYIFGLF